MGIGGAGHIRGGQTGTGFLIGEIISKDGQSIIVKLRDGGSKIVFCSENAEIGKFVSGSMSDLEVGKTVMVNGKANDDG